MIGCNQTPSPAVLVDVKGHQKLGVRSLIELVAMIFSQRSRQTPV
jgi:hypothetical protein